MGTIGANYDQPEIGNVGSKEALGSDSISQRSKGRKVFVLSSALRKEGGKKRHSSNVEQSSLVFEKVAKLATFFSSISANNELRTLSRMTKVDLPAFLKCSIKCNKINGALV